MYSHATITAFLYAGAINADLDDWGGHIGFVRANEELAKQIADHLNAPEFAEVFHPGVVEYELIEPLGAWLVANPTEADKAIDKFKTDYLNWI